jgi:hypothetical protein
VAADMLPAKNKLAAQIRSASEKAVCFILFSFCDWDCLRNDSLCC